MNAILGPQSVTLVVVSGEPVPDTQDSAANRERLFPAVGELAAVRSGDGVLRRTELAEKIEHFVFPRAGQPEAYAVFPLGC